MGQKANSTSLRLGYKNNNWPSKYIEKNSDEFSLLIFQDLQIRQYIDRFFNLHGIFVHSCTIHRSSDRLNLIISYFTTLGSISFFKTKFTQTKSKNSRKLLKKKRRLSVKQVIRTKYIDKTKYRKKLFFSKNFFVGKLLSSLGSFLKKKYTINLFLQNLNKSLSVRLTNYESLSFRKSILQLRNYTKSFFFQEAINILLLSIRKRSSAKILSEFLALKLSTLKRHNYFLTFIRRSLSLLINSNYSLIQGVKLRISGRFNGAPRSKTRVFRINNIPLQTLDSNINYNQSIAYTNNGTFGIKLWISEK